MFKTLPINPVVRKGSHQKVKGMTEHTTPSSGSVTAADHPCTKYTHQQGMGASHVMQGTQVWPLGMV